MTKLITLMIGVALLLSVPAHAKKLGFYNKKTGMTKACLAPPPPPALCTYSSYAKKKIMPYSEVEGRVIFNKKDGNFSLGLVSDGCFGPSTFDKLRFSDPDRRRSGQDDLICVASGECNERPGYFGVVVCSTVGNRCPANPQDCADDDSIEAYR